MKKVIILVLIVCLFICGCSSDNKVYDGLTLYAPQDGNSIYLINNNEEVVHSWDVENSPFGKLLPDGNILYISGAGSTPENSKKGNPALTERTFYGDDIVWEYENSLIHHDFAKLPNGNVLAIQWEKVSLENKEKYFSSFEGDLWMDVIIEIDYTTKEIVWEWHEQDEMDLSKYSFEYLDNGELMHTNAVEYLPEGNSFNGKESVMVSLREINTILIIDKNTKEIEWEYGLLSKQHNPTLLDNGNILVFDNQYNKRSSRVVEINPKTDDIVWEYTASGFFADHISGAQRLPNGNTLICEGTEGRIFEVTADKEIVWDYTPVKGDTMFRAYKYGKDDVAWPQEILELNF